jgi:hypothetical protein
LSRSAGQAGRRKHLFHWGNETGACGSRAFGLRDWVALLSEDRGVSITPQNGKKARDLSLNLQSYGKIFPPLPRRDSSTSTPVIPSPMTPERKTSAHSAAQQPGTEAASAPACLVRPAAVTVQEKTPSASDRPWSFADGAHRHHPLRTTAFCLRRTQPGSRTSRSRQHAGRGPFCFSRLAGRVCLTSKRSAKS